MELLSIDFIVTIFNTLKEIKDNLAIFIKTGEWDLKNNQNK